MSTATAPTTVPSGLYYGFTSAEIANERASYKRAVQQWSKQREAAGGGSMTFVAINGKQVTYDQSQAKTYLDEWRMNLQSAEASLAGTTVPASNSSAIRFS